MIYCLPRVFAQSYSIIYQTPADCETGIRDQIHQYFDISQLKCLACSQGVEFQTVRADGEFLKDVRQAGLNSLVRS